jgi:hypothetical protein
MNAPSNDPPEQHSTRPLGRTATRILVIVAAIVILGGTFLFAQYLVRVAEDPATQERIEQLEAQEEAEEEAQDPE